MCIVVAVLLNEKSPPVNLESIQGSPAVKQKTWSFLFALVGDSYEINWQFVHNNGTVLISEAHTLWSFVFYSLVG